MPLFWFWFQDNILLDAVKLLKPLVQAQLFILINIKHTLNLPFHIFSITIMTTKEQFEDLQLHQFHCLAFVTLSRCRICQMGRILAILTDPEIDTLTNSFQEMLTSLQLQEGRNSQHWLDFHSIRRMFLHAKQSEQLRRNVPYKSCWSEVKPSILKELPLSIVILLIIYDNFPSIFKIAFVIIVLLLLLYALSIYLKWANKRNPYDFEARVQEGGIWLSIKVIAKRIHTYISAKASAAERKPAIQDELQRNLSGILQEEENYGSAEQLQQKTENVEQPGFFRRIQKRFFPQEIELTRPLLT